MNDDSLRFTDAARSELENSIGNLAERARNPLDAQQSLRDLLAATRTVVDGLELEQVLRDITEAAVTLVDADYGALGVIGADGLVERFIDSRGAVWLPDTRADPPIEASPPGESAMEMILGIPIRTRDGTFANLYLANRAPRRFDAQAEELVTALAATAAVAIDHARLYAESQRSGRLSDAVSEVTAALLSSDTGDIFGVVAEHVASLVGADQVVIVVPGAAPGEHLIETARGAGADLIQGITVPGHESVVSAALTGAIVSSNERLRAPWLAQELADGSTVAAPLTISGTVAGALCATRAAGGKAFSPVDLATVAEFARHAGLAIALACARVDRHRLDVIEDRARIARDLHDHVIQRLFGTGLGLQALATRAPQHAGAIDTHISEIDAAIADIRTAIFTLRPSNSESVRRRLLDVVTEMTSILLPAPRITFAGPVDLIVTGGLADDVVAVVRESLVNVARHARADTADVDVTVSSSGVIVTVDDDGIGPPSQLPRASGTANLAARARALGGRFALESRTSGGTRARWCVPLRPTTGAAR